MASLVHQQVMDKENPAGGVGRMARLKSTGGSIKGQDIEVSKIKSLKEGGTPFRRVLGDVNRAQAPKLNEVKNLKPVLSAPNKPRMQPPQSAPRPSQPKAEKSRPVVRPAISSEISSIKCFVEDETEKMKLPVTGPEDEFEMVFPAVQRPTTYLEPFLEWRQWPGVFSTSEEEEEEIDLSSDDDFLHCITEHSLEENDLGEKYSSLFPIDEEVPLPSFEDLYLPLPSYKDLFQQLSPCDTEL